jgi:hypothetical protein
MRPSITRGCGTNSAFRQTLQSLEEKIQAAGGLENYSKAFAEANPELAERCRQAGEVAWAIACMRKAFKTLGFKPMPLVDFIRYLADGVQGQTKTGAEIADIATSYFKLDQEITQNLTNVCRVCKYLTLTADQTRELCIVSEPIFGNGWNLQTLISVTFAALP